MRQPLKERLRKQIRSLNIWKRGGERSPHKPLLVLLALSRVARGEDRLLRFREIEEPLKSLLMKYGPSRRSYHPAYPFWRLQQDGFWEVDPSQGLTRRASNTDPLVSELRAKDVTAGFRSEVYDTLRQDRRFLAETALSLLQGQFPSSLHEDILCDVGLSIAPLAVADARSVEFRRDVIRAYEHRCAVCGYDLKLGEAVDLGLEAAHIKWRQAGGPDNVTNGLAICAIHHKALDLGAFCVDDDMRILVSGEVWGSSWSRDWFMTFHRGTLSSPHSPSLCPNRNFLDWHRSEVFRHPARE